MSVMPGNCNFKVPGFVLRIEYNHTVLQATEWVKVLMRLAVGGLEKWLEPSYMNMNYKSDCPCGLRH